MFIHHSTPPYIPTKESVKMPLGLAAIFFRIPICVRHAVPQYISNSEYVKIPEFFSLLGWLYLSPAIFVVVVIVSGSTYLLPLALCSLASMVRLCTVSHTWPWFLWWFRLQAFLSVGTVSVRAHANIANFCPFSERLRK